VILPYIKKETMSNFIGHQKQIYFLAHNLKTNNLAHAYLFSGPEKIGKFTLALKLAEAVFCETTPRELMRNCGVCRNCLQVVSLSHPSIFVLDVDKTLVSRKENKKDIPIEDFRELKRILSLAPEEGRKRVVIINRADAMNTAAASSFLKLLEEPGSEVLFILITENEKSLLPTVVSRVQVLKFSVLADEEIRKMISETTEDKKKIERMVILSSGRPGRVVVFRDNPEILEKEEKFYRGVQTVLARKFLPDIFHFSEKASKNPEYIRKTTEYVLKNLRAKLLAGKIGDNPLILLRKIKRIGKIHDYLETTNLNPRLALDALLMEAIN